MNNAKRFALVLGALTAALLLPTPQLLAHHSFAAEYDANKLVSMSGTVVKLEWTNPHAHVDLSVQDEQGGTVVWQFELGSPNGLMRHGWNRNSLKPGDKITITGYLAKDGSKLANARAVTLADGRKIFAGTSADEGGPAQ